LVSLALESICFIHKEAVLLSVGIFDRLGLQVQFSNFVQMDIQITPAKPFNLQIPTPTEVKFERDVPILYVFSHIKRTLKLGFTAEALM
jgi:hypothetical protein